MKSATKLFSIFNIDIKVHYSWLFIFALLAWSLSTTFFPHYYPNQTTYTYWLMGIIAAILLFVSVLLHELAHSLVAKAKHIKVESITLFFFGGVAGITKEEMKPSTELQMALAGPIFSFFLAGVFYLLNINNGHLIWEGITFYLYQLNFILAIFNMVPGFPLDGGRALRAILYWHYKDLKKATKIAAAGGRFFAGFLVVLGIFGMFTGTGGGLWFILLGGFLYFIAGASYEQVVIRETLKNVPVREIMRKQFFIIDHNLKFSEFVKRFKRSDDDSFLVKNKKSFSVLDLKQVEKMPKQLQSVITVGQVSVPISKVKVLEMTDNAYEAFKNLLQQDLELLPVVDKTGKLVGVCTKKTVMHRLIWDLKYGSLADGKNRK